MKTLVRIGSGIGLVLVLWVGGAIFASRSGEVVVLTTADASGARQQTPLWIVEDGGFSWLRAGSLNAAWLARIRAHPQIEIERGGVTSAFRGTLVPESTDEINARMADKYGFADRLVGWLLPGSRGNSMAVRLDPESP
ncbi:MAG: nitroreductase/quinone reductase family protein [Myxococcota bacterium]